MIKPTKIDTAVHIAIVYFLPHIAALFLFLMFGNWQVILPYVSLMTFFMYPIFIWNAFDIRDQRNKRLNRTETSE